MNKYFTVAHSERKGVCILKYTQSSKECTESSKEYAESSKEYTESSKEYAGLTINLHLREWTKREFN